MSNPIDMAGQKYGRLTVVCVTVEPLLKKHLQNLLEGGHESHYKTSRLKWRGG
jgi:hypothetical protein